MGTISEFQQKLMLIKSRIIQQRARIALQAASDLSATIKLRIQETGVNADGNKFSPYTKDYAKKGRKDLGYQSEYVDFTRTGRMTNNIQPKIEENTQDRTLVVITARDATERAKLKGQVKKRGNIIRPSKNEIAVLEAQYSKQIIALVKTIV